MSPFFRHIEKPYTQTNSPTKSVPLKNKRLQTTQLTSNLSKEVSITLPWSIHMSPPGFLFA